MATGKEFSPLKFSSGTDKIFEDGIAALLEKVDATTANVDTRKRLYYLAARRFLEVAHTRIPGNKYTAKLIEAIEPGSIESASDLSKRDRPAT